MSARRLLGPPLAVIASLGIAGCGTNIRGLTGDLPPDAPPRAAVQPPYPNVYDIPPPRDSKLMSASEQARIEAELAANRQKVNAQGDAAQKR